MGALRVDGQPPSVHTSASHSDTDITALTEAAINQAKERLHIAYCHTSHGSQLTTGMSGLVGFANGTLTNQYLAPMSLLEETYPNVVFVYMTGHVDIGDDADQKAYAAWALWCKLGGLTPRPSSNRT